MKTFIFHFYRAAQNSFYHAKIQLIQTANMLQCYGITIFAEP